MHTLFLHWTETCGDAYTIKLETQVLVLCDPKDVKVNNVTVSPFTCFRHDAVIRSARAPSLVAS
jgi:hypothetical protein